MTRKKKIVEDAPVKFRGNPMQPENLHTFMEEWSLSQAEANHVETIEEANDFDIPDDDSEDFLQAVTVYEMHEMAEENLRLLEQETKALAESNETGDPGEIPQSHDQSAPVEPNSLDPQPAPEQQSLGQQG